MAMHTLSPEAVELAKKAYRPKVILELKEKIEAETRAAELRESITGQVDMQKVREIVVMKRQLDGLYLLWVEGTIK